jgi:hypothetical protein
MHRSVVGAGLVAVLAAAVALAAETHGTVKKVDAEGGTLTIAVKSNKETTEKEFTLTDSTKINVFDGDDKRQWTGKKGLKDDAIKEGKRVTVVSDADGKVTLVRVGTPKEQWTHGTLKKVDADAGTLTLAIKDKKGGTTSKDFTVTGTTKVVVVDGKDRKELAGKEGLKDDLFKEGVEVAVMTEGGKVLRVRVGALAKKDKE